MSSLTGGVFIYALSKDRLSSFDISPCQKHPTKPGCDPVETRICSESFFQGALRASILLHHLSIFRFQSQEVFVDRKFLQTVIKVLLYIASEIDNFPIKNSISSLQLRLG